MTIRVKKLSRRERRRRQKASWIAASTLAAYTTLGGGVASIAWARDAAAGPSTAPQSQRPVRRFDIPPGPMDAALEAFRAASGWTVRAADSLTRGVDSPGVSGDLTSEQALQQLLAGSKLTFDIVGPEAASIALRLRESVVVSARAAMPSSPKYTEALRDTPQTITVIPAAVIEEQAAMTLRDVLQNVPGLTISAGEGGTPAGDNLTLRGFSARNDVFIDGVRDLGPQSRDPFDLEQVDVVKGPGSVFSGRGSTGGTINLVSKSPSLGASSGAAVSLGTAAAKRATFDVNQPVRWLGAGTAFRLNAVVHEADVPGREVVDNRRWGLAPSLAFGLTGPTRVTASYFHLQQSNLSDYGIPWVPSTNDILVAYRDRPAPVSRDTFYGLVDRDREKLGADLATLRLEHDFGRDVHLRSQARYGRSTRDSIATPPRFASPDSTEINRELRSWQTEDTIWDSQTDLSLDLTTGPVRHSLVAGVGLSDERNLRRTRSAPNMSTTLLDPDPNDAFPYPITPGSVAGDVDGRSAAVYAFDTAHLGQRWELTGGARLDYFDAAGVSTAGPEVGRIDRMPSFRVGVVYKPKTIGSVYAAYGTSTDPSLEGLSYQTANTTIDPEKTRTAEVGTKWDLAKERLSLAASLFEVEKTNARTPGLDPDDPPQVLEGRQRVRGAELGMSGSLTRSWRVFAAYTFLDSEIVESNTPAEVGKTLPNTPRSSVSLWSTCRLPWRLEVGGGVRMVGRRFGNNTNARVVEGYTLFDAMASYPVTRHLDLRLNLTNLTDVYYFDRLGGGHVVPGPARAAVVTAGVKF